MTGERRFTGRKVDNLVVDRLVAQRVQNVLTLGLPDTLQLSMVFTTAPVAASKPRIV